ncbi:MAG: hypothetical protein AAGA21_13390 [Pseudomonadota bacterium]
MSDSIRLVDERSRQLPLGWRSRWKLEASLWVGLCVIGWEITPLRSLFVAEAAPFAEWIALGLAGAAALTAMQVKRRLRQRLAAEEAGKGIKAPNPLSLIELLREHGVREFGSMYLYMPIPRRARHNAAWVWIETLQDEGLVKGDPWPIKADHVKETVRQSHAHLFADDTVHFDVYRLDWQTLSEIMGDELA